jgi:hypothetical protein
MELCPILSLLLVFPTNKAFGQKKKKTATLQEALAIENQEEVSRSLEEARKFRMELTNKPKKRTRGRGIASIAEEDDPAWNKEIDNLFEDEKK